MQPPLLRLHLCSTLSAAFVARHAAERGVAHAPALADVPAFLAALEARRPGLAEQWCSQLLQNQREISAAVEEAARDASSTGALCLELLLCPSAHTGEGLSESDVVSAAASGFQRGAAHTDLQGGLVLCLPPSSEPPHAEPASALVQLALGCSGVLGVHCVGSDAGGSALARAACAGACRHTVSLPATPATALAAAGLALCTGAARLTVSWSAAGAGAQAHAPAATLHTQSGLLAALADAGVSVEWAADAEAQQAHQALTALRAMKAAGVLVACADVAQATRLGASTDEVADALQAAARCTLLPPAERSRLEARVAKGRQKTLVGPPTAPPTPAPSPAALPSPLPSPRARSRRAQSPAPAPAEAPPARGASSASPAPAPSPSGTPPSRSGSLRAASPLNDTSRPPSSASSYEDPSSRVAAALARRSADRSGSSFEMTAAAAAEGDQEEQEEHEQDASLAALAWLEQAHTDAFGEQGEDDGGAVAALIARLLSSLRACESAHGRTMLFRSVVHQAAPHARLAQLLALATRNDPELPWLAAAGSAGRSGDGAGEFAAARGSAAVRPSSPAPPSFWERLRGASASLPPPAPPREACVVDGACRECRDAMLSETYLARRYLLDRRRPSQHHRDAASPAPSCRLLLARDTRARAGSPGQVALLFLRSREVWSRERAARAQLRKHAGPGACAASLLRLLRAHDGASSRPLGDGWDRASGDSFGEECHARGLPPFLLVLDRASCSLAALLAAQAQEAAAFAAPTQRSLAEVPRLRFPALRTDWAQARSLGWHAALALASCHEAGLLHAALCPRHLLLMPDGRWLLTHFAASVQLHKGGELLSADSAHAWRYLPPEAVTRLADGSSALKLVQRGVQSAWLPGTLHATANLDMWAWGALMFEVITGQPLLNTADDEHALRCLGSWDVAALEDAMARFEAAVGRDGEPARAAGALLRRVLSPDPAHRPQEARELLLSRFLNPSGGRVPLCASEIAALGPPGAASGTTEGAAEVLIGVAWSGAWEGSDRGSERGSERESERGSRPPSPASAARPPLPPPRFTPSPSAGRGGY